MMRLNRMGSLWRITAGHFVVEFLALLKSRWYLVRKFPKAYLFSPGDTWDGPKWIAEREKRIDQIKLAFFGWLNPSSLSVWFTNMVNQLANVPPRGIRRTLKPVRFLFHLTSNKFSTTPLILSRRSRSDGKEKRSFSNSIKESQIDFCITSNPASQPVHPLHVDVDAKS